MSEFTEADRAKLNESHETIIGIKTILPRIERLLDKHDIELDKQGRIGTAHGVKIKASCDDIIVNYKAIEVIKTETKGSGFWKGVAAVSAIITLLISFFVGIKRLF